MKTKLILIATMILLTMSIGCSKDSVEESNANLDVFKAKIGYYMINFDYAYLIEDLYYPNSIFINSCKGNQEIRLRFPKEIGTHNVINDDVNDQETNWLQANYLFGDVCCPFNCGTVTACETIEGSITLQEINDSFLKGTFHFISKNEGETITIAQGVFDLKRNEN